MLARPFFSHCHRWDWARSDPLLLVLRAVDCLLSSASGGVWHCLLVCPLNSGSPGKAPRSSAGWYQHGRWMASRFWVESMFWSPYLWMAQKLVLKSLHPPMVWVGRLEPMGHRRWCKQWVVWLPCPCIHLGMMDCRTSCVPGLRMGRFSELPPLGWLLLVVTLMGSWFSWLFWERLGDLGLPISVETWIGSLPFWGTWSCSSTCQILSALSWTRWLVIRFGVLGSESFPG